MSKIRIFNDPIYGLVSFPFKILYELIDHPFIQRLRRIKQTGFADFVYPGSTHSRFHHALGVLHLTVKLIEILRKKGVDISEQEYEACCIASLLHDIGHGPYSHALEHELLDLHHEELTIIILNKLNSEYAGKLSLAIQIFTKKYPRKFLGQLLASQLDVDRMDYLNRDSFYTGVSEGIIGYERILSMMNVVNDELVIEEKGRYSIEKFLISRFLMYLQVYHHKTSISIEVMSKILIRRYRELLSNGSRQPGSPIEVLMSNRNELDKQFDLFLCLDDSDFIFFLKRIRNDKDVQLSYLANALLERNIFKTKWFKTESELSKAKNLIAESNPDSPLTPLLLSNDVHIKLYSRENELKILNKDQSVCSFSDISLFDLNKSEQRFILSIPNELLG